MWFEGFSELDQEQRHVLNQRRCFGDKGIVMGAI